VADKQEHSMDVSSGADTAAVCYVMKRNHVCRLGSGRQTLLLAHGFGCDQHMWRFLLPQLENDFDLVLFDYVGCGHADLQAYSRSRYQDLTGYAQDIVDICLALDLTDVVLVGHSVSSMIGLLAARQLTDRLRSIVMVCPSPCFLNRPPAYFGGFEAADLQELIDLMDKNYIGWAGFLAPLVTGLAPDHPMTNQLYDSFCSTNPLSAKTFAKATFFSDHRDLLPKVKLPVLILQSEQDALAAPAIGQYMREQMANSQLLIISARGHCLHMTHPAEVAAAIKGFVNDLPAGGRS
jgi:sigma-B regulation protein RsbQ